LQQNLWIYVSFRWTFLYRTRPIQSVVLASCLKDVPSVLNSEIDR
jgi:hypothetical protein